MSARELARLHHRQISQTIHTSISTRLTKSKIMSRRRNLVEHHSYYTDTGIKMLKTIDDRSYRISYHSGIHQQNHRKIQDSRHLGTTALHSPITIEQTTRTFHDTSLCLFAVLIIKVLNMCIRSHPCIQVDGFIVRRNGQQLGIHKLRTAFIGLHLQPTTLQGTQKPHRK